MRWTTAIRPQDMSSILLGCLGRWWDALGWIWCICVVLAYRSMNPLMVGVGDRPPPCTKSNWALMGESHIDFMLVTWTVDTSTIDRLGLGAWSLHQLPAIEHAGGSL